MTQQSPLDGTKKVLAEVQRETDLLARQCQTDRVWGEILQRIVFEDGKATVCETTLTRKRLARNL